MCQGNFAMALCSFGVVNDQCGAKSCAGQETRMRPLLSSILTWQHGWRASRRVQVCSRQEEDLVIPKRWFKQSVRDHTRAQIAFIPIQGTLPIEERRLYLICDFDVSYCLWLIDSLVNFLGSYEEHQTVNIFIVAISLSKQKKTILITWRLFFGYSSCLFTFSLSRAHAYHAITIESNFLTKNVMETRYFLAWNVNFIENVQDGGPVDIIKIASSQYKALFGLFSLNRNKSFVI